MLVNAKEGSAARMDAGVPVHRVVEITSDVISEQVSAIAPPTAEARSADLTAVEGIASLDAKMASSALLRIVFR